MFVFGVIIVRIFPTFSRIRTDCIFPHSCWIRRDTPYSVQMRGNAGKMRTRITPNTDTFYAVFLNILKVVTSSYLLNGGDKYTMLRNSLSRHPGDDVANYVTEFIKKHTPLATPLEERITFTKEKRCPSSQSNILRPHYVIFLSLVVLIQSYCCWT